MLRTFPDRYIRNLDNLGDRAGGANVFAPQPNAYLSLYTLLFHFSLPPYQQHHYHYKKNQVIWFGPNLPV